MPQSYEFQSDSRRIVARCLKKEPRKRYQSVERLRKDLERYVAKTVAINANGRLVIYLRNRGMLTDLEAKTYVREQDLKSITAKAVEMVVRVMESATLPLAR